MGGLATGLAPAVLLDRHQERREGGLPTISVLSGAVGLSVQLGRDWAQEKGQGVVVVAGDDPRPEAIVAVWVDALAAGRDLVQDALAWLARRLDESADQLGPSFGRKTPVERNALLGLSLPEETDVAAACRWLLPCCNRPEEVEIRRGWVPGSAAGRRGMATPLATRASWARLCTLEPGGGRPRAAPRPARQRRRTPATPGSPRQRRAAWPRLAEAEPRLPLLGGDRARGGSIVSTHTPPSRVSRR